MENQLAVLERLISYLNTGMIGRESYLKGIFLQNEFKRIRVETESIPGHNLEEEVRSCNFHLSEASRLADIVIRLKVNLKMKKDMTDDEFYRLMKCDALLKEFKVLIEFYSTLLERKQNSDD